MNMGKETQKPMFDRIRLSVDAKTHRVYSASNVYNELSELERELFACGAEVVMFDDRVYKRIEDRVSGGHTDVIRTFAYKLKK